MVRGKSITDILREEVTNCGKTRYQIWSDTGVDQAVLSRFLAGKREIGLETAEILLKYFGYRIAKRGSSK